MKLHWCTNEFAVTRIKGSIIFGVEAYIIFENNLFILRLLLLITLLIIVNSEIKSTRDDKFDGI